MRNSFIKILNITKKKTMPRQLTTIDRLFLDIETKDKSMGITPLYFYDPSGLENGEFDLDTIMNHLDKCIRTMPVLCGQLYRAPLDLDNPYLVEDKSFDVNNHVVHKTLNDPTCIKELSNTITAYQEKPIDTNRPLWDAMIISGLKVKTLPDNAFMIALKIHHAVADGMTLIDLSKKIHSKTDLGEPVKLPSPRRLDSGGLLGMASRVISNNVKQTMSLVNPLIKAGPQMSMASINFLFNKLMKNGGPSGAKTRFAKDVSNKRVWGYAQLEMAELNRIRQLFPSSTINDLVLTIVAGGLREYLDSKGELPENAMKALAPVNVRESKEKSSAGNQISLMSLMLPLQVEDPLERLIYVMKSSGVAKAGQGKVGSRNLAEIVKNIPAAYISSMINVMGTDTAIKVLSQLGNTIVTNMPGPQEEYDLLGAKLVNIAGVGPVVNGVGLLHAVVSYNGMLVINATSCPQLIPDMKFYIQCINRSYQKLISSVDERYAKVTNKTNNIEESASKVTKIAS